MGPTHTPLSQNMSYLYSTQYSMSIYLSNLSSLSIPLTHWFQSTDEIKGVGLAKGKHVVVMLHPKTLYNFMQISVRQNSRLGISRR